MRLRLIYKYILSQGPKKNNMCENLHVHFSVNDNVWKIEQMLILMEILFVCNFLHIASLSLKPAKFQNIKCRFFTDSASMNSDTSF